MKVLKFGGTSMANADSIRKVADIILDDETARFVVVSAPGKRVKTDTKVTDLLYAAYDECAATGICDKTFLAIVERFKDIIKGLGIELNLTHEFETILNEINSGASKDYVASRGEYLSAIVLAKVLGYEFIDAVELIRFDSNGVFNAELTQNVSAKRLKDCPCAVIPGFYGRLPNHKIKTFSRGGSDISGAIIARAVSASIYENWTDVDGFMVCDPRIVDAPRIIEMLTYKELRELSYMGANVLHPDSIFPVRKNDIPIHIRNTFNPSARGTLIVPSKQFDMGDYTRTTRTITGIAGRTGFAGLYVEKSMMNNEIGFACHVLQILERHGVSIEHMPSGIDTLTVIIDTNLTDSDTLQSIEDEIKEELQPDKIQLDDGLALIAVVGHGMSRKKGTASRIFNALNNSDVNIRMIDQGSSELNIIIAVEKDDYEKAIKAIYADFK